MRRIAACIVSDEVAIGPRSHLGEAHRIIGDHRGAYLAVCKRTAGVGVQHRTVATFSKALNGRRASDDNIVLRGCGISQITSVACSIELNGDCIGVAERTV